MIRESELAYLAGVTDSDGCIRVEKIKNSGRRRDAVTYAPIITIQQVEPQAIELAARIFGGFIQMIRPSARFPDARIMSRWTAKSRIAASAIEQLRPYLRIKAAQADNALELAAFVRDISKARFIGVIPGHGTPRTRTPAELDKLALHYHVSRALNSPAMVEDRTRQAAIPL